MKKMKWKMLILSTIFVVLFGFSIFLTFNLYFNKFFEAEAIKAINFEITNNVSTSTKPSGPNNPSSGKDPTETGEFDPADPWYEREEKKDRESNNSIFKDVSYIYTDSSYNTDVGFYHITPTAEGTAVLEALENSSDVVDSEIYKLASHDYICYYSRVTYGNLYIICYVNTQPVLSVMRSMNVITGIVYGLLSIGLVVICFFLGKRIDDSNAVKTKFFQNASHELKTPLMSIGGYAEGIESGIIDKNEGIKVIQSECDKMTQLVEEILFLSKLDTKGLVLNKTENDIRETLYDCVSVLTPAFNTLHIDLKLEMPEDPIYIKYDVMQLKKVFNNILINDSRYATSLVSIKLFIDGAKTVIEIKDDGEGMDKETLKNIFTRFYMGSKGKNGIGLSLAKEIVELHKGTINVTSDNNGTTFTIKL